MRSNTRLCCLSSPPDPSCLLCYLGEAAGKRRDSDQWVLHHRELQGLHHAAGIRDQTVRAQEDGGHAAGEVAKSVLSSGRVGPGGAESSEKGEGRASRVRDCHHAGTMRTHHGEAVPWNTLLPLLANWLNPARWILFFWPQQTVLSNGQKQYHHPLQHPTAWPGGLSSSPSQPSPVKAGQRLTGTPGFLPLDKRPELSPGKKDTRDVTLLMQGGQ